jgi:hypothetical protein
VASELGPRLGSLDSGSAVVNIVEHRSEKSTMLSHTPLARFLPPAPNRSLHPRQAG